MEIKAHALCPRCCEFRKPLWHESRERGNPDNIMYLSIVIIHSCTYKMSLGSNKRESVKPSSASPTSNSIYKACVKGCTHCVTEALRWLLMGRYRCIIRVCCSVGTLLCCNRCHSSKWLSMEKVFLWFQLNSNMSNISFAMGMFSYRIKSHSGNTYFRWISMIFRPFTLFSSLKVHFRW